MFCVRLLSSTKVSGQSDCINSSLLTTRPLFSTSTSNVSKTFGGSGVIRPSRINNRSSTSRRNGPNSYNCLVRFSITNSGNFFGIRLQTAWNPLGYCLGFLQDISYGFSLYVTAQRRSCRRTRIGNAIPRRRGQSASILVPINQAHNLDRAVGWLG